MEDIKKTAVDCAREAGAILMEYQRKMSDLQVEAKGRFDYVTEADFAVQEAIVRRIRARHSGHDILAEEAEGSRRRHAVRWILDPLDGTTNFIHGFPAFAVSIAVEQHGSIVLGVVYDPWRHELFLAEQGKGGSVNGRPLAVSGHSRPEQALVATGFPFREKALLPRYLETFSRIFSQVRGIRRTGSAALDLAYVACGRCDGFWEIGLKPWDIAAGHLLIEEAGGRISDFGGGADHIWIGDVVAGNSAIHRILLEVIQEVFGGNLSQSRL